MYDFGLLLRHLREEKGLTQAQLAEKINRSKTVISKYENNTETPTLDTLIQLAVIFNVSLDYLAGISTKRAVTLDGLSQEQIDIILLMVQMFKNGKSAKFRGLTKEQLDLINNILIELV